MCKCLKQILVNETRLISIFKTIFTMVSITDLKH
eukprot:UN02599